MITENKPTYEELLQRIFSLEQELESYKVKPHADEFSLFQHSIANVTDSIFWVDQDAKIIFANKAASQNLGYLSEELLQFTIFDIDPVFSKDLWHSHWQEILDKNSFVIKTIHKTKSGKQCPVEITVNKVEIDNNIYNCAIARDISESERIKKELITAKEEAESNRNKYISLFTEMINGFAYHKVLLDEFGKPYNYVFLNINPAFEQLTGLKQDQIIGKTVLEVLPHTEQFWIDIYGKVALTGESITFENYTAALNKYYKVIAYCPEKEYFVTIFEDITERRIAEIKLLNSTSELKKAQEIAHLGSWYLDIKTNRVTWSEELYKMYGFDPNLPVPPYTEHMKLFTPESWELLSESLLKTQETGISYELELKTIKNDKTSGWMWVRGEAVKNDKGEIIGLWGAAQDITERKRNEKELTKAKELAELNERKLQTKNEEYESINEELRQTNEELRRAKEEAEKSEEKFRKSVLTSPDAITINRLFDGVYIFANEGYSNTFGFSQTEIIGSSSLKLNIWTNNEERIAYIELLEKDGTIKNFESKFRTKTGKIIDCLVSSSIILIDNVKHSINITKDISYLKVIESQLKLEKEHAEENEKQLKYSQKVARIGYYIFNIQSGFWSSSEMLDDIFGIDSQYVRDVPGWLNLIHPDNQKEMMAYLSENVLTKHEKFDKSYRIINKKTNTIFWVHGLGSLEFDKAGNLLKMFGTIQDISLNKIYEQELITAKEHAEESDRLKTAFLQNMSHEIRTPLNAISGFTGLLNKHNLSEEKRKSFVQIIQNSSNQLVSIVTDILTISSLETKQEKINVTKVCINNIIVDLLTVFKQQAINQNISLYAKQAINNQQSEIYTDKTKLTQILSNLLANALKFTHEGFIEFGYELVETRHDVETRQDVSLQHPELQFYVKDSGIGIAPKFHDKIFERFRQADKSINKLYGGTGLGLAISKSFVELLGGKIWVESEIEKGATFFFTIPYKPANEFDVVLMPSKNNKKCKTILVAEDEEYNFLFIEELLINMNLHLIHTKDGNETVEVFKTNSDIDLVLMDIKMPIMTGDIAAKLIKALKPEIPIIAQSAYALEHEIANYIGIFDEYITKPIEETDLKQKILKYIEI